MLRSLLSFLALILTLSFSSCTKDDEPMPAPVYLLDQRWVLTELNGKQAPTSSTTDLKLPSSGSNYNGRSYCNGYGGQYELTAGSAMLRFPTQGSTYASCALLDEETQYLALLRQTTRYAISNRTLRLYGAESEAPLLVFKVAE
jgi:heat shock protein HslJ